MTYALGLCCLRSKLSLMNIGSSGSNTRPKLHEPIVEESRTLRIAASGHATTLAVTLFALLDTCAQITGTVSDIRAAHPDLLERSQPTGGG